MKKVKIIAEAGVNHNGDLALALRLAEAAHKAGADVIKFQTFIAKKLVSASAPTARYQRTYTQGRQSQLQMLQRLELSRDAHIELVKHCESLGIKFFSTAFDTESLQFLVSSVGLRTLKIPSGEITNGPFVLEHARTKSDLIVSTGMASLAEIESALGVIAFGYIAEATETPSEAAFAQAYSSPEGQCALKSKVTVLHCTTEYPTKLEDVNLLAMSTLADAFKLSVGYSDHSEGIVVPIAAVARGACLIEKHFTLDRKLDGPDHRASIDPDGMSQMVQAVRGVEIALGSGIKAPRPAEIENKIAARKSLIAAKKICKGDVFDDSNLVIKRPGSGMNPNQLWTLLGQTASHDYGEGELINE